MPWADITEFTNFLVGSGLRSINPTAAQQLLDLQGALDAGLERFEDATHFKPFLSTGSDEDRTLDEPVGGRILQLNGGLLSVTAFASHVDYANTAGTERIEDRDFILLPTDAPSRREPYTRVQLGWHGCGRRKSIKITGLWGWCVDANLPSSARRGVMALAADELMPQIKLLETRGGLVKLQRGDTTKQWEADIAKAAEYWQSVADKALYQYKRTRYST